MSFNTVRISARQRLANRRLTETFEIEFAGLKYNKLLALQRSTAEAVKQANLAYQFCPGSYTFSALNACLKADRQIRAIRSEASLPSEKPLADGTAQRLERRSALKARGQTSTEQGADPRPAGIKAGPKAQAVAGDNRKQNRASVTHNTRCHEAGNTGTVKRDQRQA